MQIGFANGSANEWRDEYRTPLSTSCSRAAKGNLTGVVAEGSNAGNVERRTTLRRGSHVANAAGRAPPRHQRDGQQFPRSWRAVRAGGLLPTSPVQARSPLIGRSGRAEASEPHNPSHLSLGNCPAMFNGSGGIHRTSRIYGGLP